MQFRKALLILMLLAGIGGGCERLLAAEVRPYLDVPPEGETLLLLPGNHVDIVARYPATGTRPEALVLYWAGEGPAAAIQGRAPMTMRQQDGWWEGRLSGWPPFPLPPGTYRLWVEIQGVSGSLRSGEARVNVPASERVDLPTEPPRLSPTMVPTPTVPPVFPTSPPASPTPTPVPCYRAKFVADVTIPDDSSFPQDYGDITKTWRLRNTGSCTWPADTEVVSTGGTNLLAPRDGEAARFRVGHAVAPGETVDVSVPLLGGLKPAEGLGRGGTPHQEPASQRQPGQGDQESVNRGNSPHLMPPLNRKAGNFWQVGTLPYGPVSEMHNHPMSKRETNVKTGPESVFSSPCCQKQKIPAQRPRPAIGEQGLPLS